MERDSNIITVLLLLLFQINIHSFIQLNCFISYNIFSDEHVCRETKQLNDIGPTHAIHIHNSQLASSFSRSTVLSVVLYSSVAVNTTVAVLTLLAGVAALKK